MKKVLNVISYVLSTILMLTLVSIQSINGGYNFSGISVLIITCMLCIIPLKNRYSQKIVLFNNPFYYIILYVGLIYGLYVGMKTIYIDYTVSVNDGSRYFFDYFIYLEISILISFIVSLFSKKEIQYKGHDNIKAIYCVMTLVSVMQYFLGKGNATLIQNVAGLFLIASPILLLIKSNDLVEKDKYMVIYIVLAILAIINTNIVTLILIIQAYLNLDKYGLNI